jgi:hypothetical protein
MEGRSNKTAKQRFLGGLLINVKGLGIEPFGKFNDFLLSHHNRRTLKPLPFRNVFKIPLGHYFK